MSDRDGGDEVKSDDRDRDPVASLPARSAAAESSFANGAGTGVGSLPHSDALAAAAFAIAEFEIASIPVLANLTNGDGVVAQAIAGIPGVSIIDGAVTTDALFLAAARPVRTALEDVSFAGLRAFLDLAVKVGLDGSPVTWQYTGPITLGCALHRAGVDTDTAFALAVRAVRTQLVDISAAIAAELPGSAQLVMLDEPALADLMSPDFPIPPDQAIDMMSSGMAAVSSTAIVGIHCDLPCDIATMLASGPGVISVPLSVDLVDWAGYLNRFLEDKGVIAWGVVPTHGPVSFAAEHHWRALSDLWCELVQRGCDPVALRRQSIVTPGGGLGSHSVSVAREIARMTSGVAKRVKDQANATRFALGA